MTKIKDEIEELEVTWGKFSDTAIVPTKSTNNAGLDIYEDENRHRNPNFYIKPFQTVRLNTNIGMVLPTGYVGIVKERSSTGKLSMFIGAGVIDESYRGQIGVFITNTSDKPVMLDLNKAIAQIVILKCEHSNSTNVFTGTAEEFAEKYPSDRGLGKEGSTGK